MARLRQQAMERDSAGAMSGSFASGGYSRYSHPTAPFGAAFFTPKPLKTHYLHIDNTLRVYKQFT